MLVYLVQRKGKLIMSINKSFRETVTCSNISLNHVWDCCEVLMKGVSDDMMV